MDAFNSINGHANGLGHTNDGALCQEFLSGTEFVIDGVSRDGVYKVCIKAVINKKKSRLIFTIYLLLLGYGHLGV